LNTDEMLFQNGAAPRYAQLATVLRNRIARGDWIVGQQLPAIPELQQEFALSRVTVRQAVELLEREQLVKRQQGRGTFVTAAPKEDRWLKVQSSISDLEDVYRGTTVDLLAEPEHTGPVSVSKREGVAAPSYVLMRRVHLHDGAPYCVIDIYIAASVYALAETRFRTETAIPVLTNVVRVAGGRQMLTIHTADVELAKQLRVPVNSSIAKVRRTFVDAKGIVVYLAEASCRGDFVHVEMEIRA